MEITELIRPKTTVVFMVSSLYRFESESGEPVLATNVNERQWAVTRKLTHPGVVKRVQQELHTKGDRILSRMGIGCSDVIGHALEDPFADKSIWSASCRASITNPVTHFWADPHAKQRANGSMAICCFEVVCHWQEQDFEQVTEVLRYMAQDEGFRVPEKILRQAETSQKNPGMWTVLRARLEDGIALFGLENTHLVMGHRQIVPEFVGIRDIGMFALPPPERHAELYHAYPSRAVRRIPGLFSAGIPLYDTPDEWTPEVRAHVAMSLLAYGRDGWR